MFTIKWSHSVIGNLSDISTDMWYISGIWSPNDTKETKEFINILSSYDRTLALNDPAKALRVILFSPEDTEAKLYCIVLSLNENELLLRQVVSQEALDVYFPDRS